MRDRLFVVLFFLLCLFPVAGILILGPAQPAANEILPSPPTLVGEDGRFNRNVLSEFSDYLEKHFALRQELVTANHKLHTVLFHTSSEDDVIVGKNGWLFYGETLDDYEGINGMTDRELWSAAHALALMQEYCENRGVTFLFTVAPNKNSLYGQYMPDRYPAAPESRNVTGLTACLSAEGVHYVDLFSTLAKEDTILYRRLDSHWTQQGAGLAGDTLLAALGRSVVPFYGGEVNQVSEETGDLYEILYPTGHGLDEDQLYTRPFTFTYVTPIRSVDDNFIRTQQAEQDGSLLMFRDSFGNALHLFMAEGYGKSTFCRLTPYNLGLIDTENADTVVIELVERNLEWLITRPAIFPAPVRQVTENAIYDPALSVTITVESSEELVEYCQVSGVISAIDMDQDSPIYLKIGDTVYEATPTGEDSFVAYIPEGELCSSVSLLLTRDGQLYESKENQI